MHIYRILTLREGNKILFKVEDSKKQTKQTNLQIYNINQGTKITTVKQKTGVIKEIAGIPN